MTGGEEEEERRGNVLWCEIHVTARATSLIATRASPRRPYTTQTCCIRLTYFVLSTVYNIHRPQWSSSQPQSAPGAESPSCPASSGPSPDLASTVFSLLSQSSFPSTLSILPWRQTMSVSYTSRSKSSMCSLSPTRGAISSRTSRPSLSLSALSLPLHRP